ncbi:putative F-box associated interaction domain-containing protein [Helianthus anomalus]
MEPFEFEMFAHEILSRLPSKCVGRFKSVCKQRRYELSSSIFSIIHSRRMYNSEHRKLITLTASSIYIDNLIGGKVDICQRKSISFPVDTPLSNLMILAAQYGLLLMCIQGPSDQLILWNPTTNKFLNLCHNKPKRFLDIKVDAVGIYLDSLNDVKILHLQRRMDDVVPRVFSMNTHEWKTLTFLKGPDYASLLYLWSNGTLCNNVLYFASPHYWAPHKSYMIAFDVVSETFSKLSIPQFTHVVARQRCFLKIRNVLHMFVVVKTQDINVKLFKFEDQGWLEVSSFTNPKSISFELCLNNLGEKGAQSWSFITDWGIIIEIKIDMKDLQYLQDAETFQGLYNVPIF